MVAAAILILAGTETGGESRPELRVRYDKVDKLGVVTLRYRSKLYHVGMGRRLAGTEGDPSGRWARHPNRR